jgi:parallel beta-helix repeat protein
LQGHVRDSVTGPIDGAVWTWTVVDPTIVQSITSNESAVTLVPLKNGATDVIGAAEGASDTSVATVTGISPLPPGVAINPGDNWQTKIDANPTGTVFICKTGVHRFDSPNQIAAVPKASQQFFGEPGCIMTGARELTSWTVSGVRWKATGQTQENTNYNPDYSCQPGHDGCFRPEQLWVDGVLFEHRIVLADVTAGSENWHFDYAANEIYIGVDPAGKLVETSVGRLAFSGSAANVVVKHITIEKFANEAQKGVVNFSLAAGWTIDSNEVRWNHGTGLVISTNGKMRGNYVHHQGQMGVKAFGTNPLVEDNEIAFNNTAWFGPGPFGEAGGTKFVTTNGLIVRGNYSHDNDGPGLWTDINNVNCLYENNEVHDNKWRGIFHEISYDCVIRNNVVTGNGHEFPSTYGAFEGAGILISNSQNVEVYGNDVQDNRAGIMAREEDRESSHPSALGPHNNVNVWVHDNFVKQTNGQRAGGLTDTDPNWNPYSAAANNRWTGNDYVCVGTTRWRWTPNSDYARVAWQAIPMDATGSTFTGC